MKNRNIDLQRIAYAFIILCLLVYAIYIAKGILAPLVFAVLFAFVLKPFCDFLERKISWPVTSILLTFLTASFLILTLLLILSLQFQNIYQDMPSVGQKLQSGFKTAFNRINQSFHFTTDNSEQWIRSNISTLLDVPVNYLKNSISSSARFITVLGLTGIYTFLLLLYRRAIKKFLLMQFGHRLEEGAQRFLNDLYRVVQQYLQGLVSVMLVVGILNSLGLWIIGVKYPLFWGFLAAILAIIPFIGSLLGGLLPTIYVYAMTGTIWQPLAVIGLFVIIQFAEGNIITPRIVGDSVKVNPLAAILALVIGGTIWGAAGLILAVPFLAMIRKVMDQVDVLKPLSLLLSSELYDKDELFEEKFDEDRYRLLDYFKKDES